MALEALKELGTEKGLDPETEDQTQKRERKEKNAKTLTLTEARKEVLRLRKDLKAVSGELEEIKQKNPGAGPVVISPEMWGQLPSAVFDSLAARMGEHWRLNQEEKTAYGQAVMLVAERYLPDYTDKYPELAILLLVTVQVTVPRVKQTLLIKAGKIVEKEAETNADAKKQDK